MTRLRNRVVVLTLACAWALMVKTDPHAAKTDVHFMFYQGLVNGGIASHGALLLADTAIVSEGHKHIH